MIPRITAVAFALVTMTRAVFAAEGVVSVASSRTVKETIDRLETSVKDAGFAVVARVDHAGAAAKADLVRPARSSRRRHPTH